MVYGITDIGSFVLGTVFIILLPGPNSFYVMTLASRQGAAAGWRGALGIFAGDTVLMTLSACGVAGLLNTYPALFFALKYAGAAYLGGATRVRLRPPLPWKPPHRRATRAPSAPR